jgi:hypothetical protein
MSIDAGRSNRRTALERFSGTGFVTSRPYWPVGRQVGTRMSVCDAAKSVHRREEPNVLHDQERAGAAHPESGVDADRFVLGGKRHELHLRVRAERCQQRLLVRVRTVRI